MGNISEEMLQAYQLHKEGQSYRAIASVLGIGKSTIERWVKICMEDEQDDDEQDFGLLNAPLYSESIAREENTVPHKDGTTGQVNGTVEKPEADEILKHFGERNPHEVNRVGTRPISNNALSVPAKNILSGHPVPKVVRNKKGEKVTIYFPDLYEELNGNNYDNLQSENETLYPSWQLERVNRMDGILKLWLTKLKWFSNRKVVYITEFKSVLSSIVDCKRSSGYGQLPKNYKYLDFIDALAAKLGRLIKGMKDEGTTKIKFGFEDEILKEIQEVLEAIG